MSFVLFKIFTSQCSLYHAFHCEDSQWNVFHLNKSCINIMTEFNYIDMTDWITARDITVNCKQKGNGLYRLNLDISGDIFQQLHFPIYNSHIRNLQLQFISVNIAKCYCLKWCVNLVFICVMKHDFNLLSNTTKTSCVFWKC